MFPSQRWSARSSIVLACCLGVVVTAGSAMAETKPTRPDNTRVNHIANYSALGTADQQKNAPRDVELVRRIRRSLTSDKSLSVYAHNVKILAQNGEVVIKGPVRSDREKAKVEAKAAAIAGSNHIQDEITIAR